MTRKKKYPNLFYLIDMLSIKEKETISNHINTISSPTSRRTKGGITSYLLNLLKGTTLEEIDQIEKIWIKHNNISEKSTWRLRQKAYYLLLDAIKHSLYYHYCGGIKRFDEASLILFYFNGLSFHQTIITNIVNSTNPYDDKLWFFYPPHQRAQLLTGFIIEYSLHTMYIESGLIEQLLTSISLQTRTDVLFNYLVYMLSTLNNVQDARNFYVHFKSHIKFLHAHGNKRIYCHISMIYIYAIFGIFSAIIGLFATSQMVISLLAQSLPYIIELSITIRNKYKLPPDVFNESYVKLTQLLLPLLTGYPLKIDFDVSGILSLPSIRQKILTSVSFSVRYIYYLIFKGELNQAYTLLNNIEQSAHKYSYIYYYAFLLCGLLCTYMLNNESQHFTYYRQFNLTILHKSPILYFIYYLWRIVQLNDLNKTDNRYKYIYEIGETVYKYCKRNKAFELFGRYLRWFSRNYIKGTSPKFWYNARKKLLNIYLQEPHIFYIEAHFPFLLWLRAKEKGSTLKEEMEKFEGFDLQKFESNAQNLYNIQVEPVIITVLEQLVNELQNLLSE